MIAGTDRIDAQGGASKLHELAQLLEAMEGHAGVNVNVTVSVQPLSGRAPLRLTGRPQGLTPLMQQILGVLSIDAPTKASVIATRLGKNPKGGFQTTLDILKRFGVIKHAKGEGYQLVQLPPQGERNGTDA